MLAREQMSGEFTALLMADSPAGLAAIQRDFGLEVPTRDGWRARFDNGSDVEQQVASLRSVRDEIARTKATAQLIDVRFGDRPYFR